VIARAASAGLVGALLIVLGASGAAAGDAPPPSAAGTAAKGPKDAPAMVKSVFEHRFAFCHEPAYPLTADEVSWCALMPGGGKDVDPRCPRFAEACQRGETARIQARPRRHLFEAEVPAIPGMLAWVLLGIGVVAVVTALVRQSFAQAAPPEERPREPAPDPAAAIERERARAVETDVQRLLERARAAAAAGDFAGGLDDAYAAWLRRLEGEGVVRVETGRTNGDHLREVGAKLPAARQPMREIVAAVERVQFGGDEPDEGAFRLVYDGVVRLLSQSFPAQAALLLVLTSFTLIGCVPTRANWDESPSGRAAVVALLSAGGFEVHERFQSLTKLDDKVEQLLLMPDIAVDEEDWKALDHWVSNGGTLIIAGGTQVLPPFIPVKLVAAKSKASAPIVFSLDPQGRLGTHRATIPPGAALALPPEKPAQEASQKAQHKASDDDDGDDDDEDDAPDEAPWPLLTRAGEPYAAQQTHGVGRVIVFADDRLFTNAALLPPGNAEVLLELMGTGGKRVELADEVTGLVATNPLASVQRGRLAPALMQLALLALLFFAFKGAHFGRPVDPLAVRRRAFAEHARALGTRYAQARAARHALGLYGAFALERLRERLHLSGGRGLGAVAEAVAARSGRPLGDVMRVLVESRPDAAAEPPDARAAAAHELTTLREIATLLAETGGASDRTRIQG
jgi:hypothetical protein